MDGTNEYRSSKLQTRGCGYDNWNNHRWMVMGGKKAISELWVSSGMRKDMEISDSQARTYEIKQLDLRKR